ncbi:MAG: hypothetical protein IBX62_08160 [Coriobacteriia bacterium]|nr:hypothetical protein [Coriobacteriia bacterium]
MHPALPAATLLAIVGAALLGGCVPVAPPDPAPKAKAMAVSEVDVEAARGVVDRYITAAQGGDREDLGSVVTTAALEATRALSGAESVEVLSVTRDESGTDADSGRVVLVVECDVSYPDQAMLSQSGLYVFRVTLQETPEGWRIEKFGP